MIYALFSNPKVCLQRLRTATKFHSYLVWGLAFATSCGSTKNINYFPDIKDQVISNNTPFPETQIQVNDLLSIVVSSPNPQADAAFNAPNESSFATSVAATSANTLTIGYLVDQKGNINYPRIGELHVLGMTKFKLSDTLAHVLDSQKLLVHPIVTVRYLNFRVSVMGEVSRPGVFTTPVEKLSILEALSFAGDITIYGSRNNVLLIRESENGDKTVKHLDLTDPTILGSSYYYLKSNDVLIVPAHGDRVAKEKRALVFPIIFAALSFLIVLVSQISYLKL